MSRLPSLTIRLVPPRAGGRAAWPLETLTAHLEAAGHRVERSDSTDSSSLPDVDVVHCLDLTTAVDVGTATDGVPVVVTPSVGDPALVVDGDAEPLAGTTAAVVRSRADQARVHTLGVPWSRTWVVPAAVDVDLYRRLGPMANRTERFRLVAELSGSDDGLEDVLIAVAKLEDIELVVLVAEAEPVVDLTDRETVVRTRASQMGVSPRLVVVAPASAGERAWWLRSAHVVVAVPHVPCAIDVVAQAMACGTPVIATTVDALADLVVHGVTGFHVPVSDPLSLARAVRLVVDDDFTVESYGMAAADRALSRFAWPRVTHELVGAYRRAVAAAGRVVDDTDEVAEADATQPVDDERIA
jgi:glycosyltransferase involved in cell wall biosynthesis